MSNLLKAAAAVALCGAGLFASNAAAYSTSDMYVVMFRSDNCAPCKVVEPNLRRARHMIGDPKIEYFSMDFTPGRMNASSHTAAVKNIVPQFNGWAGITGFAAIIDADTKRTLGCVNMNYDAQSMAMHIRNLKTYAVANRSSHDITCPAYR